MIEEKYVRKVADLRIGVMLADTENRAYHWVNEPKEHPLFETEQFLKVRMLVTQGGWGMLAENVQVIE